MPARRPRAPGPRAAARPLASAAEPARTLVGRSRAIQRLRDQVRHRAGTRAPVLLEGEPGTGKSVVARALHYSGPRRERRFERVSCAALPDAMLLAELFGGDASPGAFERTDGGTVMLDEIDRAGASAQLRVLRLLQERVVERAGGAAARLRRVPVNVRLIAASDRDLAAEVRAGRFRDDLYHALAVTRVHLPPLRARREDIPVLVEELVRA